MATGIQVINDFRRGDIAVGGQGAPLAPLLHQRWLADENESRVVVNIGGIANLTVLPAANGSPITGFDSGPGNTLLDDMARRHIKSPYDRNGAFGASGKIDEILLAALLNDPYFKLQGPRSTGPEYFNRRWLNRYLYDGENIRPDDLQATLTELTAVTITQAMPTETKRLLVCGGGVHNEYLLSRLQARLPNCPVESTAKYGLAPDWVEAVLFAWLAHLHLQGLPGNLPAVTGASRAVPLGSLHLPG